MKKSLVCILLTLVMLLSFAACGKNPVDKLDEADAPDESAPAPYEPEYDEVTVTDAAVSAQDVLTAPREIVPGTSLTFCSYDFPVYTPWYAASEAWMMANIYEGLVYHHMGDPEDIRPLIAESRSVSEDHLTWTFQIRQGICFTDGTVCDAAAVSSSWDFYYEADPYAFNELNIASWEATGEYEFTVHMSSPCPWFENGIAELYIASPAAVSQYGLLDNRSAVGTAPYYVSEYITGKGNMIGGLEFVFAANPDYYLDERKPTIETIRYIIENNNKKRVEMLLSGKIDGLQYVTLDMYNELLAGEYDGVILNRYGNAEPIFLNAKKVPEFEIFEVRKAINRFIDLEELNNELYDGLGLVQTSLWSVGSYGEVPWPEGFYYNREEGLELMAEAGIDPAAFHIETVVHESELDLFERIQEQLGDVGITIEPDIFEIESSSIMKIEEVALYTMGTGYTNDAPYQPWIYFLQENPLLKCVWTDIYDPELYAAMCDTYDEMLSSFTWDEMLEKSKILTDMLQKDYGALPGVQAPSFVAFSKRLKGIVYISEQHVLLWNYLYL